MPYDTCEVSNHRAHFSSLCNGITGLADKPGVNAFPSAACRVSAYVQSVVTHQPLDQQEPTFSIQPLRGAGRAGSTAGLLQVSRNFSILTGRPAELRTSVIHNMHARQWSAEPIHLQASHGLSRFLVCQSGHRRLGPNRIGPASRSRCGLTMFEAWTSSRVTLPWLESQVQFLLALPQRASSPAMFGGPGEARRVIHQDDRSSGRFAPRGARSGSVLTRVEEAYPAFSRSLRTREDHWPVVSAKVTSIHTASRHARRIRRVACGRRGALINGSGRLARKAV